MLSNPQRTWGGSTLVFQVSKLYCRIKCTQLNGKQIVATHWSAIQTIMGLLLQPMDLSRSRIGSKGREGEIRGPVGKNEVLVQVSLPALGTSVQKRFGLDLN
ncbi:GTP-binding protein Rhes [Platysternon megacephalum]|uniref:GTP-binding protein Rhes n=1 Tax=Platysternon megacephalum TaxID=55544 RepID=A0A4D9DWQ6_9SAUR|nr:GTP-binding protein Rhes [Platysternon megacephalum]